MAGHGHPATGEAQIGELWSRLTSAQNETLSQKQQMHKRDRGVAQVVDCLPSKCQDLNSTLSAAQKKKKRKKERKEKEKEKGKEKILYSSIINHLY
jgi:hypothetical protein